MNIVEKLSREVERVVILRAHYEEVGRECGPRVNFAPQIAMMSAILERAHAAAGSGDVTRIVRSMAELREWQE